MIAVIRMDSGRFNIFGTEGDSFILQGNLTLEQLIELRDEATKAIDEGQREATS